MNVRRVVLAGAAAALSAACGGGGTTEPTITSGDLEVRLATTATDVGAISFTVSGGSSQVATTPVTGYRLFTSGAGTTQQVIVVGTLASGTLARFTIPNRLDAASYTAQVTAVASSRGYALLNNTAFTLSVVPVLVQ